eukprot:NODE_8442_length_383_cov_161.740854.p4 GENE.NODE_8442_length_383_cov_161.740854~~NODE_8442_length_383_cov_161.740854.p4  ORF type:complete len:85 (+),score=21.39 NODE_8442_length_383_cov_161.740854:3-257(+)
MGGRCWLECENPEAAPTDDKCPLDSRYFGAMPLGLIEGLVVGVVWPPWRWHFLETDDGDGVDGGDGDGGDGDDVRDPGWLQWAE